MRERVPPFQKPKNPHAKWAAKPPTFGALFRVLEKWNPRRTLRHVQSTAWSLSTVCSPFPAVTLPGYLADQGVQDSHELQLRGNRTDLVDENPTQTLPLRRQLMPVLSESSAVRLTHRGARPVVLSAAAYLGGHRVLEGEANELHAMGPACADSSQANQLLLDLRHHATNPPPATP